MYAALVHTQLVSYQVMSFQRYVCVCVCVCQHMFVAVRTFLVRDAVCLASVELLPGWDLMSPELCRLLHL